MHRIVVAYALTPWLILAGMPAIAQTVSVTGVLTNEGVECPAMRGEDGELYTLNPRTLLGGFKPGDRLRVTGTIQEISFCQQGITIGIESIVAVEP